MNARIVDANLNRVAEGLRVIEDYTRFVLSHEGLCSRLADLRHRLNATAHDGVALLLGRDIAEDARAYAPPAKRPDIVSLLRANFKRATEGLRVLEEYTGEAAYNRIRYDLYILEKEVVLLALKPVLRPGVYLISDSVETLLSGVEMGACVIQLRDKHATKAEIYTKACVLKERHRDSAVPFVLNDHLDMAMAIGADGVHTGQDDMPISVQRKLLGEHRLIGRTTHSLEQGKIAVEAGVDYVSVGPIWETPSKPGRAGIGFDYLRQVAGLGIPYVAIGGISMANLDEVLPYQPPMIGIIRAVHEIPDIRGKMGW